MERIKLLWDFRGPDAEKIAVHHKKHLDEFASAKALHNPLSGIENISELHTTAFLVVNKEEMKPVRDALKPHRGQLFSEK